MKILVLEDNEERIKWFKRKLEPFCDLTMFSNAELAIEKIKEEKFDVIFLDHDLGGKVYVDSNEPNTGYQVAKIIPNTINKDSYIIIHSLNPVGIQNMMNELNGMNVIRMHFGTFDFNWIDGKLKIVKRSLYGDRIR
jgi:CheY-like chemotaxis protein